MRAILIDNNISIERLKACPMIQLISDWYCLRHARELARQHISPQSIQLYTVLAREFSETDVEDVSHPKAFFAVFLEMLKTALTVASLTES